MPSSVLDLVLVDAVVTHGNATNSVSCWDYTGSVRGAVRAGRVCNSCQKGLSFYSAEMIMRGALHSGRTRETSGAQECLRAGESIYNWCLILLGQL